MNSKQAQLLTDRLSAFVDELTPYWPLVGGAIAVVDRSTTIASFGFGHADREARSIATTDHIFQIGSISKTFVSIVINQLADEGILGLDESITQILPWMELGTGEVTVRHLLSHTGGIILGGDGVPDDLAQLWALRHLTRSPEPLQHFHYSNLGYMLLGQAVRARTGTSLATVMQERIFTPLSMASSLGAMRQSDRARMATGYWPTRDDIPWAPGDPLSPALWFEIDSADGNVASTASDMARFARFLLGDGTFDGTQVLSEAALERITSPAAPGGEDVVQLREGSPVSSSVYGLGINREDIGGNTCLTHGGGMVGFQSFLLVDRTEGIGVVVLTNANGCYPVAQVIARAAHHLARGGTHVGLPPADSCVSTAFDDVLTSDRWCGEFVTARPEAPSVTVMRTADGRLTIEVEGIRAPLTQMWTGRFVTSHPKFRDFRWDAGRDHIGPHWIYGPDVYRLVRSPCPLATAQPDAMGQALLGTYRSYSPWYPTFRVFWREGHLVLAAPGGVEAPAEDCTLVPVTGGWRIGVEEWLPERLAPGPIVDGHMISVWRDGVEYSRVTA